MSVHTFLAVGGCGFFLEERASKDELSSEPLSIYLSNIGRTEFQMQHSACVFGAIVRRDLRILLHSYRDASKIHEEEGRQNVAKSATHTEH
jgi:hypothetical protein